MGGCLSDLLFTMGTPWEFNLDDAIFVFEEVGSSPHGIDRALLQLSQAGIERVKGVVIGDLTGCEWNDGGGSPWPHTKTLEEVLEERLSVLAGCRLSTSLLWPWQAHGYGSTRSASCTGCKYMHTGSY